MEFLLGTYAVAWAAVSAYVLWLVAANGRLARRLDRLEAHRTEQPADRTPHARVA